MISRKLNNTLHRQENMTLTSDKLKEYLIQFSDQTFLPKLELIREFDEKYGVRIDSMQTLPSYIDPMDVDTAIFMIKNFIKNIEVDDLFMGTCRVEIIEAFWIQEGRLVSKKWEIQHDNNRFNPIRVQIIDDGLVNILTRVQKRDIPIISLLRKFGYDTLTACLS